MDPASGLLVIAVAYFGVLLGVIYVDPIGWFDEDGTRRRASPEERLLDEETHDRTYGDD